MFQPIVKRRWQCIFRSCGKSVQNGSKIVFSRTCRDWQQSIRRWPSNKLMKYVLVLSLFLAARWLLRITRLLSWRSVSHFYCGMKTWVLEYRSFLHSADSPTCRVAWPSTSANIQAIAGSWLLLVIITSLISHPQSRHMAWHPTILQWCTLG